MSHSRLLQLALIALLLSSASSIRAQESAPTPASEGAGPEEAPAVPAAAPAPAAPEPATPAPVTKADLFPEKPPTPPNWTLTTFPLLLVVPILEVTLERRLKRNLGVAFMLGSGSFTDKADMPGEVDNKFKVFEIGTSLRYYGLGNFQKGLQFGAAAEYVRLSGENIGGNMVSGVGSGLLLAGFIGYKYTWSFGLTLEGQLGPSFAAIQGETDDGAVEESSKRFTTYINLNAGWTF